MLKKIKSALYPVEWLVLISGAVTIALFYLFDIAPRSHSTFYVVQILTIGDNYVLALGVFFVLLLINELSRKKDGGEHFSLKTSWLLYLKNFLNPRSVIRDLRLIISIMLILAIFAHMKHLVPIINTTLHDETLLNIEKTIFGGKLIGTWLQQIFGTASAPFFSEEYIWYYMYMNTIVLFMVLQRNLELGKEFALAFGLLWIIGVLLVYVYPTWGPCFFTPESFSSLPETPVTILQRNLWLQKLELAANPKSQRAVFLISGLPSLHVGVMMLGTVYLRWISKLLMWFSLILTSLTLISTLYLGWHYVIDHVAAIILVWFVVTVSRKISRDDSPVKEGLRVTVT